MSLLDAMPSQAYYTVRTHYLDKRTGRYMYSWQKSRYLDNFEALKWSTGLGAKYGLTSENVLFQWNGTAWQKVA